MRTIILILAILSLSACSSGGGGGNKIPGADLPELTSGQKDRLQAVGTETSDVSTVLESHGPQRSTIVTIMQRDAFRPLRTAKNLSQKGSIFEKDLNSAINFGDCGVSITNTTPSYGNSQSVPQKVEIGFEIKNPKSGVQACPISYSNMTTMTTTGSETNATVTTNTTEVFEIFPETTLYDEMDITEYRHESNSKVTTNFQNNRLNMQFGGGSTGSALSKTEGSIGLVMAMSGGGNIAFNESDGTSKTSMNLAFTATVNFPDFTAVGHSKINLKMSTTGNEINQEVSGKFYINGGEVSEEEFGELFQMETEASETGSTFFDDLSSN